MRRRDGRRAKHGIEKWGDDQSRSRRELGQNFLKDRRIARRIVAESGAGRDDLVVELGAGGGMLTRQLARVAGRVVAVEYDPHWAMRLGFHPAPEVAACLMVAAKRDPPLVEPGHRHHFLALVSQAFRGRGNSVGRLLRPTFTKTQLRRLARDNQFALCSSPSMLTVRQWASLFDFMVRMVPSDRWPRVKRHAWRGKRR